jgi:beta-phosphoglucomutase-like phosphatase (HAD superfamily)
LLTPIDISDTCSKRSPEIFTKACEMLGENSGNILVIEDSLHCILSAKAAGCVTLGVFDEFSKDDWADIQKVADYSVLSLKELISDELSCL